jgi:hypothetical protein
MAVVQCLVKNLGADSNQVVRWLVKAGADTQTRIAENGTAEFHRQLQMYLYDVVVALLNKPRICSWLQRRGAD